MTFKDYLKEMIDAGSSDMTPAEYARYLKKKERNPTAAARNTFQKEKGEADLARKDTNVSPEERQAQELEAKAARKRMRVAQQRKAANPNEAY